MKPEGGALQAFSTDDLTVENLTALLSSIQGTHNCYFQVNLGPAHQKAKKETITGVRMLHVDIDDLSENTVRLLTEFRPEPSVTVMSGGGYQAFWFLDQIYAQAPIFEELNNKIRQHFNADACQNIDRIMRLPGTLNVPNAKKRKKGRTTVQAEISSKTDKVYTLNDFDHFINNDLTSPVQNGIGPVPLSSLDPKLLDSIPPDIQELIEYGDTKALFPSRSEAVWRMVCTCVRVGLPANLIAGLLLHKDNVISESILERSEPTKEALRQVKRAGETAKSGWPDGSRGGRPLPTHPNTIAACNKLEIEGLYDTFKGKYHISSDKFRGELSDSMLVKIRREIENRFAFDPGKDNVYDALVTICAENEMHSIRDFLPRIQAQWDKTPRLRHLFHYYFDAQDTELNSEIGEIVMVALIRRVRQPGCKFDTIPVLEGPQGSGKSSALEIIAGKDNFSDQDLLLMDAKAQAEALQGIWIYEISELQGLHKADIDKVKAFASRTVDRVRPAYGRTRVDRPREGILIGTTNEDKYLRDTTGNRRFLPIRTGRNIRLKELERDRYQLLGEAVFLEQQGRSITLSESLWTVAAEAQHKRLTDDSWADILREIPCYLANDKLRVSSRDVLEFLGRTSDKQSIGDFQRARDAMRTLGWSGPKLIQVPAYGEAQLRGYEATNDGSVPHCLIGEGESVPYRPSYARVVDENFTVGGNPVGGGKE
jgi:hypothetical protein